MAAAHANVTKPIICMSGKGKGRVKDSDGAAAAAAAVAICLTWEGYSLSVRSSIWNMAAFELKTMYI